MNRRRDEAAAKGGERLLEPILALHNAIRRGVVQACERQAPEKQAADARPDEDRAAQAPFVRRALALQWQSAGGPARDPLMADRRAAHSPPLERDDDRA